MNTFRVILNIKECNGSNWDQWCSEGAIPGVDFGSFQNGWSDFEYWKVTAKSSAQAKKIVMKAIGKYDITIHAISILP